MKVYVKMHLQNSSYCYLDNVKFIDHKSFHINPRICVANVIYRDFEWFIKQD